MWCPFAASYLLLWGILGWNCKINGTGHMIYSFWIIIFEIEIKSQFFSHTRLPYANNYWCLLVLEILMPGSYPQIHNLVRILMPGLPWDGAWCLMSQFNASMYWIMVAWWVILWFYTLILYQFHLLFIFYVCWEVGWPVGHKRNTYLCLHLVICPISPAPFQNL